MIDAVLVVFVITSILVLGGLTYFSNPRSKVNKLLASTVLWAAIWATSNFLESEVRNPAASSFLLRLDFASAALVAYFFLLFCVNFPSPSLRRKIEEYIAFIPIVALALLSFSSLIVRDIGTYRGGLQLQFGRGPLFWIYALCLFLYMGGGSVNLVLKWKKSSGIRKAQISYVLLGLSLSAFLALFINLILSQIITLSVTMSRVGIYGILLFAGFTTYAIVTYRLMDITVVITRGGVLAGTYAFIIGVPALVASVARPWLMGAMERFWWVPPLGLFAGLALVGPFVALFLIRKIEARQREKELRAEEHLERTAQGMIEIDSVGRLVKIIPRYLTQFYYSALDIRITHATIFLLDKDKGEYVLKSTSGTRRISLERTLPEKENPIYIWFKKIVPLIIEKRFVRRRELDVLQREDIDFWLKEERLLRLGDYIKLALIELKKLMVELKAVLCVPSYYQDGLLGFLILGEKEKGLFRPQELALFFRLSRYAGLAIRSAQLSQDLQQAYASVAQADRLSSMGQLAASFAHEINNPVAIIISGIELSLRALEEDLLKAQSLEEKEKAVKYTEDKLEKIKGEAFRISRIIGRIMGYVRAPMGDFTSVRLEDLIEATLGLVEHPLRKKQINVVKEIPEDLPKIRGIAGELQEVFLNLFNNAIEAIKDETPGSINILARTVASNPEMVEIKVSDTGGGISPENLRKIFDFLFTTKLQGTGVGLSVVYNIIKKHDGTIDVESEVSKGTTFTIRLPVWKKSREEVNA
ncbi:MAG: ATP-binding protein [bacterium]